MDLIIKNSFKVCLDEHSSPEELCLYYFNLLYAAENIPPEISIYFHVSETGSLHIERFISDSPYDFICVLITSIKELSIIQYKQKIKNTPTTHKKLEDGLFHSIKETQTEPETIQEVSFSTLSQVQNAVEHWFLQVRETEPTSTEVPYINLSRLSSEGVSMCWTQIIHTVKQLPDFEGWIRFLTHCFQTSFSLKQLATISFPNSPYPFWPPKLTYDSITGTPRFFIDDPVIRFTYQHIFSDGHACFPNEMGVMVNGETNLEGAFKYVFRGACLKTALLPDQEELLDGVTRDKLIMGRFLSERIENTTKNASGGVLAKKRAVFLKKPVVYATSSTNANIPTDIEDIAKKSPACIRNIINQNASGSATDEHIPFDKRIIMACYFIGIYRGDPQKGKEAWKKFILSDPHYKTVSYATFETDKKTKDSHKSYESLLAKNFACTSCKSAFEKGFCAYSSDPGIQSYQDGMFKCYNEAVKMGLSSERQRELQKNHSMVSFYELLSKDVH